MKLYTYYRSQASFRVRIALNLKGIARRDSWSGPHAPASRARGRIFWRAARSRSIDFRVLSQLIEA